MVFLFIFVRGSAFLTALTAKSGVFCEVHYGKVPYIGIRAAKFCVRPLYSFMTEHAPEPENEENKRSTQFWKWDFPLPVMVPLLEMGNPISRTGKLRVWVLTYTLAARGLEEHVQITLIFNEDSSVSCY